MRYGTIISAPADAFSRLNSNVKEVASPQHALLEFTRDVDGIMVNGVDIMSFDDAGKINEFKVMARPLKAENLLHAKMRAMLEQMSAR